MRKHKKMSLAGEEEAKLRRDFDSWTWVDKIDNRVSHAELLQCISMLADFYAKQAQNGLVIVQSRAKKQ